MVTNARTFAFVILAALLGLSGCAARSTRVLALERDKSGQVVLHVSKDGRIITSGYSITLDELRTLLEQARKTETQPLQVLISVGSEAPWSRIEQVLEILSSAKVWTVTLGAKVEK